MKKRRPVPLLKFEKFRVFQNAFLLMTNQCIRLQHTEPPLPPSPLSRAICHVFPPIFLYLLGAFARGLRLRFRGVGRIPSFFFYLRMSNPVMLRRAYVARRHHGFSNLSTSTKSRNVYTINQQQEEGRLGPLITTPLCASAVFHSRWHATYRLLLFLCSPASRTRDIHFPDDRLKAPTHLPLQTASQSTQHGRT